MRSITIDVAPDGSIQVEAHGFKGKGCQAATEAIEKALGATGKRKLKNEYWQSEVKAQQKVGGS